MLAEYKKFDTKRCFGIELEVSSVRTAVSCPVRSLHSWIDNDGVAHPKIKKEHLRDAIKEVSRRPILVETNGNGWAQTANNDYWHVKYDSTCGPLGKNKDHGGWEVASFKASGLRDLCHIGMVANHLAKRGVEVNDNCGLHIHADASDLSPHQVAILLGRWLKIENWICQLLPIRRRKNKYCKLMRNYFKIPAKMTYDPDVFWLLFQPHNLDIHENWQKKVAINTVNYAAALKAEHDPWYGEEDDYPHRKTIEFRMPEGTLCGRDIINWTKLYLMFVEESVQASMPENYQTEKTLDGFMGYLGLGGGLLDGELCDLERWVLERMIEWGVPTYQAKARKKMKSIEIT